MALPEGTAMQEMGADMDLDDGERQAFLDLLRECAGGGQGWSTRRRTDGEGLDPAASPEHQSRARSVQPRPGKRIYRSNQYVAAQQRPETNAVGRATSIRPPRYPSNATVSSRNCTKIKLIRHTMTV